MADDDNVIEFIPVDGDDELPPSADGERGLEVQEPSRQEAPDSGGGPAEGAILEEMDKLRAEMDRLRELYLRKLAEFDNFRKRVEREKEEMSRVAAEDLVRDLVPVLDTFDRALGHEGETDVEAFRQGLELIARQLWDVLARRGLQEIDPEGQQFDPEYHEAVQRVEDSNHPAGTVVSVLAKGYTLGGRLVRPAMVAVAVDSPSRPDRPGAGSGDGTE